jgi:signal transduction histidine kinase
MERPSRDELVRLAGTMAQDIISELAVADSAINLMLHDDSVPLKIRGKLSLLSEQVRNAAIPAKWFMMRSRPVGSVSVVDLSEAFVNISPLFERLLSENVQFELDLQTDLWPIRANVPQLEHAFITLVVRARDAMPNGGTFLIRSTNIDEQTARTLTGLSLCGDQVLIEMTDTGFSIPPGERERIFDPFFISKTPAGGFALAKAYSAIVNNGGRIFVRSGVSKGTTFCTVLPRVQCST